MRTDVAVLWNDGKDECGGEGEGFAGGGVDKAKAGGIEGVADLILAKVCKPKEAVELNRTAAVEEETGAVETVEDEVGV